MSERHSGIMGMMEHAPLLFDSRPNRVVCRVSCCSRGVDAIAAPLSSRGWVDVRAYRGYSPRYWNLTRTCTHTCGQ